MEEQKLKEILNELCENNLSARDTEKKLDKLFNVPFNHVLKEINKLDLFKLVNIKTNIKHMSSMNSISDKFSIHFLSAGMTIILTFLTSILVGYVVNNISNVNQRERILYVIIDVIFVFVFFGFLYPYLFKKYITRKKFNIKFNKLVFLVELTIESKTNEFFKKTNKDINKYRIEVSRKQERIRKKKIINSFPKIFN